MLTNDLLNFLLSLFSDPAAAAAFKQNPEHELDKNGFKNLCSDDVDAIMPVLLDHSPISYDRSYNTGSNGAWGGDAGGGMGGGGGGGGTGGGGWGGWSGGGGTGGGGGGGGTADHAAAVQQLTHVMNNYSYTSVDDKDFILDRSINQTLWTNGDLHQVFDQDTVIAYGEHSVAAGDDVIGSNNQKDSNNNNGNSDESVTNTNTTTTTNTNIHSNNDNSKDDSSVDNSIEVKDNFVKLDDHSVEVKDNNVTFDNDKTVDIHNESKVENSIEVVKTDVDVDYKEIDVDYKEVDIDHKEFSYENDSINQGATNSVVQEDVNDDAIAVPVTDL